MSAATPLKFDFSQVTKARDDGPQIFVLYSEAKWGKTTLMCSIPGLFILVPEEGLKGIDDPAEHFPRSPRNLTEFYEALDAFEAGNSRDPKTGQRRFRHLAIDSLSWIETMIHQDSRADVGSRNLGSDFQSGHKVADSRWDDFVERIVTLRRRVGVHVWLIAHAEKTKEVAITGETYDKNDLRLAPKAAALLRGRADHVFFGAYRSEIVKGGKGRRTVGRYTGRVIYTRSSAHHFAGSRSGVPEVVNATWPDLVAALKAGTPAPAAKLRADIEAVIASLPEDRRAPILADLATAKSDRDLSRVLSRAEGAAALQQPEDSDEAAPAKEEAPPATPAEPPATKPTSPKRVEQRAEEDEEEAGPVPLDGAAGDAPGSGPRAANGVSTQRGDEDDVIASQLVTAAEDLEGISKALAALSKLGRLTEATRDARGQELRNRRDALLKKSA
jgi:hypothetical protein